MLLKGARQPLIRRPGTLRYAAVVVFLLVLAAFMSRAESSSFRKSLQRATQQVAQFSHIGSIDVGAGGYGASRIQLLSEEEELEGGGNQQEAIPVSQGDPPDGSDAAREQGQQQQQEEEEEEEAAAEEREGVAAPGDNKAESKRKRKKSSKDSKGGSSAAEDAAAAGADDAATENGKASRAAPMHLLNPPKVIDYNRTFGSTQDEQVHDVLQQISHCKTVECLILAHDRLGGRSLFNLPHFFLVGWSRCATTAILRHLKEHPEVLAGEAKEPSRFFTACRAGGGRAKRGCLAEDEASYLRDFLKVKEAAAAGLGRATFDASTDYVEHGEALAVELYRLFPWLKVVIVLREPIARTISHAMAHPGKGGPNCTSAMYECIEPLLAPASPRSLNYSVPLEGWLKTFPKEQVHVVLYESLEERPEHVMTNLKGFLGLDLSLPASEMHLKEDEVAATPIRRERYRELVKYARSDAQRTAAILTHYGAGHANGLLQRWEDAWQRGIEGRCNDAGNCLLDSQP